jgi:ornithine cyclodeaminase/alanine dehydrogenase-like protein (mu-crystallin family)
MGAVRILGESDVRQLVSPLEAQGAVEEAFRDLANGVSQMAPRVTVPIPEAGGNIRMLPAVRVLPPPRRVPPPAGYLGVKVYTGYVGPAFKDLSKDRFTVLLYDYRDGALVAVIAARWLGALRTGATSAVATRHLARGDARVLALIGTGEQGETQVLNLAASMKPARILVWDVSAENRDGFVARLSAAGIAVEPASGAEQAAREADVLCLTTTSRRPVIETSWVRPGTHINAVGANLATRREVPTELVAAARVVVEYRPQALEEAGDLVIPIGAGELSERVIAAELGEVLTGRAPGRTSPDEITLFKSIGVAIEDIAVAATVYEKAVAQDLGVVVKL